MFIRMQRSLAKMNTEDCLISMDKVNIRIELEKCGKYKIKTEGGELVYTMGIFNSFEKAVKAMDYIYEQILTGSKICTVPEDNF
jgi:hypothetical protein